MTKEEEALVAKLDETLSSLEKLLDRRLRVTTTLTEAKTTAINFGIVCALRKAVETLG